MESAKKQTANSFAQGLQMDSHYLNTPQTVLTNALNATLITKNGNEIILQNDMGNGRVDSAFLPAGYVPLGTAEYGGVIYIVSKNPINNLCLIGSFPSPLRNIPSELLGGYITLSSEDFKLKEIDNYDWDGKKTTSISVYTSNSIVKQVFGNEVINPGDEFIINIYLDGSGTTTDFLREVVSLYGDLHNKFITITQSAITNSKLKQIDELKLFSNQQV